MKAVIFGRVAFIDQSEVAYWVIATCWKEVLIQTVVYPSMTSINLFCVDCLAWWICSLLHSTKCMTIVVRTALTVRAPVVRPAQTRFTDLLITDLTTHCWRQQNSKESYYWLRIMLTLVCILIESKFTFKHTPKADARPSDTGAKNWTISLKFRGNPSSVVYGASICRLFLLCLCEKMDRSCGVTIL